MNKIPQVSLIGTDLAISVLGLGGWLGILDGNPSVDEREQAACKAVNEAVEVGINYFDTSPAYHALEGERLLGVALKSLPTNLRSKLIVSSKVGTDPTNPGYDGKSVRLSLENSLKRLNLDSLTMVFIHDPDSMADQEAYFCDDGALAALEEAKRQGLVQFIGLAVRKHRFLDYAVESGRFDAIMSPYDFNPICYAGESILRKAYEAGLVTVNASPYHAGMLAGLNPRVAHERREVFQADLQRAVEIYDFCQEHGLDVGAQALHFGTSAPFVSTTLVGPRNTAELKHTLEQFFSSLDHEKTIVFESFIKSLPPLPGGSDFDAPRL